MPRQGGRPVLDSWTLPHVLENIIGHAEWSVLLAFRAASRACAARVDALLARHIIVSGAGEELVIASALGPLPGYSATRGVIPAWTEDPARISSLSTYRVAPARMGAGFGVGASAPGGPGYAAPTARATAPGYDPWASAPAAALPPFLPERPRAPPRPRTPNANPNPLPNRWYRHFLRPTSTVDLRGHINVAALRKLAAELETRAVRVVRLFCSGTGYPAACPWVPETFVVVAQLVADHGRDRCWPANAPSVPDGTRRVVLNLEYDAAATYSRKRGRESSAPESLSPFPPSVTEVVVRFSQRPPRSDTSAGAGAATVTAVSSSALAASARATLPLVTPALRNTSGAPTDSAAPLTRLEAGTEPWGVLYPSLAAVAGSLSVSAQREFTFVDLGSSSSTFPDALGTAENALDAWIRAGGPSSWAYVTIGNAAKGERAREEEAGATAAAEAGGSGEGPEETAEEDATARRPDEPAIRFLLGDEYRASIPAAQWRLERGE